MKRGNTYTQLVTIAGVDLTAASEVVLTVKPLGRPPIEFTGESMSISADSSGTTIAYKLTEEQSLSLGSEYRIDVNWMLDGNRGGTNIDKVILSQTLLNRVIGGGSDTPDPSAPEPDIAELTSEEVRVLNAISPRITDISHAGSATTVTVQDIGGTHTLTIPDGEKGAGISGAVLNADYTLTLTFTDGTSYTTPSIRGEAGADGASISAITKTGTSGRVDTYTVTLTDGSTYSFEVTNGANGTNGVSPSITVTDIPGGHRVTITDADGAHSLDVLDGTGSLQDVQVNGVSVLDAQGVANITPADLSFTTQVTGTTPTITALSGIQYVCGEVATLDIALPASGIVDIVFESGSTPTVLTITPQTGMTVEWANDFDSTALEADTLYELNIKMVGTKCLGVAGSWS